MDESPIEKLRDQFVDGGNPGVGRAIAVASLVGVVLAFVGVGGVCLAAGYEWTTAVGLGAFSAVWSGLGFGFMFGGIAYVTKLEVLQEAERQARRVERSERPEMARSGAGSSTLAR